VGCSEETALSLSVEHNPAPVANTHRCRLRAAGRGAVLLLTVGLAAACGGGKSAPRVVPPLSAAPDVQFGYVKGLTRLGKAYKLRFDLGVRLAGRTGAQACIDNDGCRPGTTGLPDDVYDHDFHYVVTYRVPPDARVTMVAAGRPNPIRITPSELYALAHGRSPLRRRFMDPTLEHFGFYLEAVPEHPGFDSVARLEQAYHP